VSRHILIIAAGIAGACGLCFGQSASAPSKSAASQPTSAPAWSQAALPERARMWSLLRIESTPSNLTRDPRVPPQQYNVLESETLPPEPEDELGSLARSLISMSNQFREMLNRKIAEFAQRLKGKEAFLLQKRLLAENPLTLQAAGGALNISRERARLIEKSVMQKLKTYLKEQFPDFDDLQFALK
jgi:hypothetical protein